MSEVIAFKGAVPPDAPHGDLVETLEKMLAEAKDGTLRGLAYATVRSNGDIGTGWDGAAGTRYPMGAAISILAVRYPRALADLA